MIKYNFYIILLFIIIIYLLNDLTKRLKFPELFYQFLLNLSKNYLYEEEFFISFTSNKTFHPHNIINLIVLTILLDFRSMINKSLKKYNTYLIYLSKYLL